ncbi:MAG: OmpA family protein [Crocinitomicaceae bacterium]|nr:OmpA family protein [Crocinitomicaceae bacterium]
MIQRLLVFLISLITLQSFGQTFEVEKIEFTFKKQKWEQVNSKFSDFGAVLAEDRVIFCTNRAIDQVIVGENNWKKGKHYNIYSFLLEGDTLLTAELKKPRLYAEKFTSNSHSGPICFSVTQDTVFFSRVEKAKLKGKEGKFHFKPQMYRCIRQKNGWGKLEKLEFNQNGYSFSHPSYDSKNGILYFASDIPGGKGASDIYSSKMDSTGGFSVIENLGDQVNTAGVEMFPHYYRGDLFFSSDREGGKGKLDLYFTYKKEKGWSVPENLGDEMNTAEDDFSMYLFGDYTSGLMASKIDGEDDIFYFDVEKKVTIQSELVGLFSYRNLNSDASGIKIQVTSDDTDLVFETISDADGKFNLRELPSGEKYTINIINEGDEDLYVTFYDDNGEVLSRMIINKKGKFEYKQLGSDVSLINLIENEDDFSMSNNFVGKIVSSDNSIPDKKLQVALVDSNGTIIQATETDRFGNFEFREIDLSANNRIKLQDADDDYGLFVFNEKGEIIAKLKIDENGMFTYRKLENESADLELISSTDDDFSFTNKYYLGELINKDGKKVMMDTIFIAVYDKNKSLIDSTQINGLGDFVFAELPVEDIYLFRTNYSEDPLTLNLYNYKGELVAKLVRDPKSGFFLYKLIANDTTNIELTDYNENADFNFNQSNQNNQGNNNNNSNQNNHQDHNNEVNASNFTGEEADIIYFDVNSSYMTDKEKSKLNALANQLKSGSGSIIIEGHTDINGDNDYNQWLSERRSQRVFNYLIAKGVDSSRIQSKFYGEEKPEKLCPDGNCTEEQVHKFNRRVTIKMGK